MFSMEMLVWIGFFCLCILSMLAVGMVYYVKRCMWWQSRIRELREERAVYLGWNLKHLKETERDLEYERVDRMELIF